MSNLRAAAFAPGAWAWLLASACLLAGTRFPACGQNTQPASAYRGSKRFLIVVETSAAMKRRSEGTMWLVRELMMGGMGGQLRSGDSIGIWTYSQKLTTGKFPLQQWSLSTTNQVIASVLDFVKDQSYSRRADFEILRPALQGVIASSDFITVLVISDGSQKISGTPFDAGINEVYESLSAEQARLQQPFLTVLRGQKGVITHGFAAPAQQKIGMPPLPAPPPPVVEAAPKPPSEKKPPIGKPLIVVGPKPAPAPPPAMATATNAAIPNAVPAVPPPTAEPATPSPASATSDSPPNPAPVIPAQDPGPPKAPRPATVEAPDPDPSTSAPVLLAIPAPAPAPLSATPAEPKPAPETSVEPPVPSPAQTATAVTRRGSTPTVMLMAGAVFVLVVFLSAAMLWSQRSRKKASGSLITESYDHDETPKS